MTDDTVSDDALTGRAEKAFSFAQETAKQQITLCTGVLTITLTFAKDIAPSDTSHALLEWSWGFYLASIVAGVFTLMTLTGNIERPNKPGKDSIYSGNIVVFSIIQALAFLIALGFTFAFGVKAA